jgi:hypothetical protein
MDSAGGLFVGTMERSARSNENRGADGGCASWRQIKFALIEGLVIDVPVAHEESGQLIPVGYHVEHVADI